MVAPRVYVSVIGLLVFLAARGNCITAFIGDPCCLEDWGPFMDKVLSLHKTHAADLKATTFVTDFESWLAERDKTPGVELDDICEGRVGLKCEGTKDSAKCVCNKDTGFVPDKVNKECVANKAGGLCLAGSKPENCKTGPCNFSTGKFFGVCATDGKTDEKGGSYSPRPILWVIIGGLALIPSASS